MPLFLRDNEPIPPTHYVADVVFIPELKREAIRSVERETFDITSYDSPFRTFLLGPAIIHLADGERLVWPPDWLGLALKGGGAFWVCEENREFGCITCEQYERLERERAEDEAMEAAEWMDYGDSESGPWDAEN